MDSNTFALNLSLFVSKPSNGSSMRLKCAELLEILLTDLSAWSNLPISTQSSIKTTLLHCFEHEESIDITNKFSDIILKLAPSLITVDNNSWPELLPCLYQCVSSSTSHYITKCLAFAICAELAKKIGGTIFGSLKNSFHSILRHTLFDDTLNVNVRVAAMFAAIEFIICVSSSNEKEQFQYLLAGMMKLLPVVVSSPTEELFYPKEYPPRCLIKLAKHDPRFLRMQLVDVVSTVLDIVEDECMEEKVIHAGVEFLLTLVEAKEKAPGMMKKLPLFVGRCFAMLLNLLVLHIKDDPAWHSAEDVHDEAGITSTFRVGCFGLKRFSCALGRKSVAHEAKEQLSAYLAAREWEKRHAALYALTYIAHGCSEVITKYLEPVMSMILNRLQDPHPRVRWAACLAISNFFDYFEQHVLEQYHNRLHLPLSVVLDDFHPRVQRRAMATLCMICISEKPETLIPHLDGIVTKLLVLIQNEKQIVQQEALATLGAVANSVKEHFWTYYDTVMPHLKDVIRNAAVHDDAITCISFIGLAVGKEKFREDVKQIIGVLMPLQGLQERIDHISTWRNLWRNLYACVVICECMGKEFLPYLSELITLLIQTAKCNNENCGVAEPTSLNNNSLEKVMFRDKTLWMIFDIYLRKKSAHACILLERCTKVLKEDFYPWIPKVVSVLVPLMKFHSNNLVRKYAVKALPSMLHCAKLTVEKGIAQDGSESYFMELSDNIIKALVEALHKEQVGDLCLIKLHELHNCLKICGPLLHEGWARIIVDEIKHIITDSSSRKLELREREKCEDFDDEEAVLLKYERELEQDIFIHVTCILRTLIKALKAAFLPFLDELSSYLLPMLAKEETTSIERSTSIGIFDDLMEEFPEDAIKYYDPCLPLILDASNDDHLCVRQSALYGLRLWAENDHSSFKHFIGEAIPRINKVIMHSKARESENESAHDNAVSALGMICEFHGESIDLAQVIPVWLNSLPIKADMLFAQDVHEHLCSMVERFQKELFGPNNEYIPKVVSVFAKVLCSKNDLVTEDTANRMINVLRHLHQTIPTSTMLSELPYLLPQHEMELKSILSLDEDDN